MGATLFAIVVSMALSVYIVSMLLPKILMLSLRKRVIDSIDSRKVHNSIASRLGGVAFFPAIYISLWLSLTLFNIFGWIDVAIPQNLPLMFAALLILYIVGLYDDIIGVGYRAKFMAQIATGLMVVVSGTSLDFFYGVNSVIEVPHIVGYPLTILFIVFVVNAINLIDGINGLASMLSIIALLAYGSLFLVAREYVDAMISFTTASALAPFWYHNVFGIRRRTSSRIFMGDCGALVVGFVLALMSIRLWNIGADLNGFIHNELYYVMAYTMLFIPCIDVLRVIIRRYRLKRPIFLPDKNHIHHKFMALGCNARRSLWAIIVMQMLFVVLNLLLSFHLEIVYIFAIDVLVWIAINIIMRRAIDGGRFLYGRAHFVVHQIDRGDC